MKKYIVIGMCAGIMGAGVYLGLKKEPTPVLVGAETQQSPEAQKTTPEVSWVAEHMGTDPATNAPLTKVTAQINGKVYNAGVYQGSCSQIGTEGGLDGKGLMRGEFSAMQCWFAGGGNEIGLFNENGKWVLKTGTLDEGSEETGPFRGEFKTVVLVSII